MKFILLIFLSLSCAQTKVKESFINEIDKENISKQTILDLARTSYQRGCVDSKNYWLPEKNKSAFNECLKMAREHEKDIHAIISQEIQK